MNRGDSGGTARDWETEGVVLNARHVDVHVFLVVVDEDGEIRHAAKAAWSPHNDGRASGDTILFSPARVKAFTPLTRSSRGVGWRAIENRDPDWEA